MKNVVFDSYALLELFENGPGAQVVADLLTKGGDEINMYLSEINLGEIYYILFRRKNKEVAEEVIEYIQLDQSLNLVSAEWQRIKQAAQYKTKGGLSYADCFILALAFDEKASIVTGDPEIIKAAEENELTVIEI